MIHHRMYGLFNKVRDPWFKQAHVLVRVWVDREGSEPVQTQVETRVFEPSVPRALEEING